MPKLNTNNEEVIQYFCKICEDWIRKFDIDGIRFDVGNEVSHRFLKKIREHLKQMKPDLYLLGEIWHDASQWLLGDEYDTVMNYPLMSGIHDFFLDRGMEKEEFEYMVNRCYTMYMQQSNNVMFNLLDSHDTDEIVDTLKEQFSEMTNLEQVVKECKDNGLWSPDGLFTDSGVEAINKMAMDSGLIDKPVAKSDLVDDSFAKKAAGK